MASDVVVALAETTMDGQTLFGHNYNGPTNKTLKLVRSSSQHFTSGETVQLGKLSIAQVRHTADVLGSRLSGEWGYQHGVNEHGVAIGLTQVPTRLHEDAIGLAGAELVRLGLERTKDGAHAVELLMDLICRHGLANPDSRAGSAFLIADRREAFVLVAAGKHWALQNVGTIRALGESCQVRRDWDRVSHGLGDLAIARGWWPADGTKLDFEGTICSTEPVSKSSLHRWGQLTLRLEHQSGRLNAGYFRSLLGDDCLGSVPQEVQRDQTLASLVARLDGHDDRPQVWFAFGTPSLGLYFPLTFESALPKAFTSQLSDTHSIWNRMDRLAAIAEHGPWQRQAIHEALTELQQRFEQMAADYQIEARLLRRRGELPELERLAESFHLSNLEQWDEVSCGLLGDEPSIAEEASLSIG